MCESKNNQEQERRFSYLNRSFGYPEENDFENVIHTEENLEKMKHIPFEIDE